MSSTTELDDLIQQARDCGAGVTIVYDEDARRNEGRRIYKSIQVTGLQGIGPYPMSPLSAAETLRNAHNARNAAIVATELQAEKVWYIGPKHQIESKSDPDGSIAEHVRQGDRGWNYYLTEREAIETVIGWLNEDEYRIQEKRHQMIQRLNDIDTTKGEPKQ